MKLKVLFIRLEYFNNFNNKFHYINLVMVRKLLKNNLLSVLINN